MSKAYLFQWIFILGLLTSLLVYLFITQSKPFKTLDTIYPYYDFIVVGAGTAGCVIASRLSEMKGATVLLIEAGEEFNYLSKVPVLPTLIQRGPNDWSYNTTSQKYSSLGLVDKQQYLPRGKGLGGSGQLNYFLHGLGVPEDYEKWVEMGGDGWNYDELEPIINEVFEDPTESKKILLKVEKKIRISEVDNNLNDIGEIFMNSVKQLNNHLQYFTAPILYTIYNGQRQSSYVNYLQPYLSKNNLHILPNAVATKIHFKKRRAYSVEILQNNRTVQVMGLNEIILSCGAFNTPKLLMHSGIGPRKHLMKHNIEIISALEGVGANLHDHLNMPIYITIDKPLSITLDKVLTVKSIFDYLWNGKGYFSSPGVVAYVQGPGSISVVLFAMGSTDERLLRYIANTNEDTFRGFFPFYANTSQEGIVLLGSCLQPKSRGTVRLQSINPGSLPLIDPKYLSEQHDMDCMISSVRLIEEMVSTRGMRAIGAKIHWPSIEECMKLWTDDINEAYLDCIIRHGALTGHHAGGTCSMAGDSPVVDPLLMVHGVDRLRIMDASVFPTPISSSPNSIIIAMAEKTASIIKDKHNRI